MAATTPCPACGSTGASDPSLERAKLFRDHAQSIITLSTGALALSVTFLHDIASNHLQGWLIQRSWIAFVLAVVFGILYDYVLLAYVRAKGKSYALLLGFLSILLHLFFLAGLVYMVRFAFANS